MSPGKSTKKAATALLAAFPDQASIQAFVKDSKGRNDIDHFINFAERQGVISKAEFSAFQGFINQAPVKIEPDSETQGQGLTTLLDSGVLLGANGVNSVRNLVSKINGLMSKFTLGDGMQVSGTMLSRLRAEAADSPKKRHTLRSLAFWIGYSRPDLATRWNYSTLHAACAEKKVLSPARHGARVGFFLHSLGDAIDSTITRWLEREINNCLTALAAHDGNKKAGPVQHYDMTTFFVDFPILDDECGIGHPAVFDSCARDAVAMTHQILLRWTLSPWKTPKRRLTLGIVTGLFADLTPFIKTLLNTIIDGNPAIRVSDAARHALIINDVRVQFASTPAEINIYTGEAIKIWSLTGLLSPLYWDFIPAMLEDPLLRAGSTGNQILENRLYFPTLPHTVPSCIDHALSPSISTCFNSPQNSFLALEVAKVLFYRRHLWDANEILRLLLSTAPCNLVGRVFRMMIYWNLGLLEKRYAIALRLYQRAEAEAEFIRQHCPGLDEDYYCEQALGKVAHALHIFRLIRRGPPSWADTPPPSHGDGSESPRKETVFALLQEALALFQQGMAISPWGHRSFYYNLCVRSFIALLERHPSFFNQGVAIEDPEGLCLQIMQSEFSAFGWLREDRDMAAFCQRQVAAATRLYSASVQLRSFKPTIMLAFAILTWDFSPRLTVGIARNVLVYLQEAETMALDLEKEGLCIYSKTRLNAEIMTPEIFLKHLGIIQEKIMTVIGSDLEGRDEDRLINGGRPVALKLFAVNICEEGE